MKKTIIRILVCIYIVIAVFTTINLLTYNDQNISEFGGKVFLKLKEDIKNYQKGSLLVVEKSDNYKANDNVFYCQLKKEKCIISYGTVDTMMGELPTVNNQSISQKLIIGKDENVRVVPVLGSIMNTLESRLGFLCVVVLPILVGFLYELCMILKETKNKK